MKWTLLGIIETVAAVILALWVLAAYFGGSGTRSLADKYDAFEKALRDGDRKKAAALADALAERVPAGHDFRLQAAGLRFAAGDVSKAKSACKKLAGEASAPKRTRALARVMLATAAVGKEPTEESLKAAREEAEAAVIADPDLGDAHALLGIILAWQGQHDEAATAVEKALEAKVPPAPGPLAQAYVARASSRLAAGEHLAAMDDLHSARALMPGWKALDSMLFSIRLAAVCSPGLEHAVRSEALNALRSGGAATRKALKAPKAQLALALAEYHLGRRNEAISKLESAARSPETKAAASVNLAALMKGTLVTHINNVKDKREQLIRAAMKGAGSAKNPWMSTPRGRPLLLEAPVEGILSKKSLMRMEEHSKQYEALARAALSGGLPEAEEKALKKALALLKVWRFVLTPKGEDPAKSLADAIGAVEPLVPGSEDPWIVGTYGALLLRAGRSIEAVKVLRAAAALAPGDEELAAVVKASGLKPVFSDFHPGKGSSAFVRPLIGVTVGVRAGPAQASEGVLKMELDGKEIAPVILGSDVSYFPEMPLLDGEHVVAVSFADPFGNKAEQSFKFYIDNAPPVVRSFSPEQDQTVSGPRPTFVLECEDQGSGIDLSSVNIIMSPLEAPGTTFRDHIIKNGKYTFTSFTEPKFRKGQPVGGKRVVFTSKRDLTVKGRYLLDFDFTDNRGLHAKNRRWVFRIE